MAKYTTCKSCRRPLEVVQFIKKCTNLGCIEYNKPIGAKVVRKKIQKSQEEE